MAGIMPEINIDGPEASAPVHSLLRCALDPVGVNNKWPGGFKFRPDNCVDVTTWDPFCPNDPPEDGDVPGDEVEKSDAPENEPWEGYEPFVAETAYLCDSTGWTAHDEGAALRQLEAGTAKALGYEFWTGELKPGNRHLASPGAEDITPVPDTPASIGFSLSALVQALANCGAGGRGMIHATPFLASSWANHDFLITDPLTGCLMTKVGHHIVVPDPGYPGTGPDGSLPPENGTWAYATGMVQKLLTPGKVLSVDSTLMSADVDGAHGLINTIELRAERHVAAWWGCCHVAILSEVC